jgi:hypothetical protein
MTARALEMPTTLPVRMSELGAAQYHIPVVRKRKPSHGDLDPRATLSGIQKLYNLPCFHLIGDEDCGKRYANHT